MADADIAPTAKRARVDDETASSTAEQQQTESNETTSNTPAESSTNDNAEAEESKPAPEDQQDDGEGDDSTAQPKKFSMVCSSNMNRSMEAHHQLSRKGLDVKSYGVGTKVRLPGPSRPMTYEFGTPYKDILKDIERTGEQDWFRERGLLSILERNVKIKEFPERFQDDKTVGEFDVIVCFEERVFDILMEDLNTREPGEDTKLLHVVNLDVKDNSEDSVIGGQIILDFCLKCEQATNLEEDMPEIIEKVEAEHQRTIRYIPHYL